MFGVVEKIISIGKISVAGIGVLCTFYTVIDLMVFLSDPNYIHKQIGKAENESSWSWALLKNMSLLSIFIIQHSILALPEIKNIFAKYKLKDLQRSVYVITTCIVLQILIKNWSTTSMHIWSFDLKGVYYWLYYFIHILAWLLIYIGSICMDINELLGLKQVYYSIRNFPDPTSCKSLELQQLYAHMRHPSFVAFAIIFWFTPVLSLDRFLFAFIVSSYMYLAWKTNDSDYRYQQMQYNKKFL